ncbi:hypothetical protein [Acidithiobacillus sp.]
MTGREKWVVAILAAGVFAILLGVFITATRTRIPVSHIYVNAQGAHLLAQAGESATAAADWPGAFRANPKAADAAFWPTATLDFGGGHSVTLPRRDVLLWVYRG